VLFDRFGVSRSIPAMMLVGAAGAALFGLAGSAPGLALGRALSGLGCGAMIMGAVVICAQLVPREKFAALVGAVLALGQIGNILGTAPLAHLSAAIGWRASFVGLAALTVAVAGLYAWGMRRAPVGRRIGEVESLGRTLRVTLRIFADRRLWPIFALAFTGYSTMFALIALWFGLYLDALGLDLLGRGNVLFAVAVAFAFGLFLFGRLQLVLHSIKAAVLLGAGGLVALLAVLAALPAPPVALVVALFMLAGVAGGFTGSVISHGGLFYRPAEFGRGVTAMNTLVLAGATAVQFWSGPLFDAVHGLVPGGLAAYRILFAVLALWLAGGLVLYRRAAATPEDFEAGFSKGKTT
jgi:predicted MFS family arabinose efflux permease